MTIEPCAVVPVFNHHEQLGRIVAALLANKLHCILVDDGSGAETKRALRALNAAHEDVEVLILDDNEGKGAAVLAGIARADKAGYTHALQIDADGQHNTADVPKLLSLARRFPNELISGLPQYDESIPAVRYYGRYLTHALIWLDTFSRKLSDTMCGFRVYPVAATLELAVREPIGARMDFDTDVMTRLFWAGVETRFVATRVCYPDNGVSHYRMVRDNARMTWLHMRLFAGMLRRAPELARRRRTDGTRRHWTRIGERGSLAGLRLVGAIDRVLGRRAALAIVYPVVAWFFLTQPRARRASSRFLSAAGANPSRFNQFRHLMSFAVSILDKVAAWRAPDAVAVDWAGRETFRRIVSNGRGALFISAHLGNLELARAAASEVDGARINALVYSGNARKFRAMLSLASETSALNVMEVDTITPETACLLREKIDAGEIVVIVGDRTPVAERSPVIQSEFLGRSAPFAIGPYVLAHVLECPVYLLFCMREAGRYRVYLEHFAERLSLPREGRGAASAQWVQRYAARLADYAQRFPLQWYNFYDFWRDDRTSSRAGQGREAFERMHYETRAKPRV
jgi:predicted LPLAT superfamily acyltransferase